MSSRAPILLFLLIPVSMAQVLDVCALVDEPMFCTCDVYGLHSANTVSCSVSRKISSNDLFWRGFRSQQKIVDLTIGPSKANLVLDFIPSYTLRSLPHLKVLRMRNFNMETLWPYSFNNMSQLEEIHLDRNNVKILEVYCFSSLENLKMLRLSENSIKRMVSEALYKLPNLQTLHLDQNNMTTIEDLAFVELSNLEELNLQSNHLRHLTSKTFVGLRSLKSLDLSRNRLSSLGDGFFSGANFLEELDLLSNQIHRVNQHAFSGLNHLKILRISHNQIKSLGDNVFIGTPSLRVISLSWNRLNHFQKELLEPLHVEHKKDFIVHLRGNPLRCACDLVYLVKIAEWTNNTVLHGELQLLKCHMHHANHTGEVERRLDDDTTQELNCPVFSTPRTTTTLTTPPAAPPTRYIKLDSSGGNPVTGVDAEGLKHTKQENTLLNAPAGPVAPLPEASRNTAAMLPTLQLLTPLYAYFSLISGW